MPEIKIERPDIKTAIMILSLLIAFTGLRFYDVFSFFNQTLFPKPFDTIGSVEDPEIFR